MVEYEGGEKKTSALMALLLVLFLSAGLLIGIWMYDLYKSNRTFSQETSKSAIECNGYIFEIDETTLRYGDNKLSFSMVNEFGDQFNELVVESGNITKEVELRNFIQGSKVPVTVSDFGVEDEFTLYPKGCRNYNQKTYKI